jgi:hypothetical protein
MGALTNNEPMQWELVDDNETGLTIDEAYALLAGLGPNTSELPAPQIAANSGRPRPPMRIYPVSTT